MSKNKPKVLTGKNLEDFRASLSILKANLAIFNDGNREFYRVIAVELFKLVSDQRSPLIEAALGRVEFMQLKGAKIQKGTVIRLPGTVRVYNDGRVEILNILDVSKARLPLRKWRQRPLFTEELSLSRVIKIVRDKEGAHADKKYGDKLDFLRSVRLGEVPSYVPYIVAVGQYILDECLKKIGQESESP